jgi:tryptophan synthase alpha chain
MPYIMGGYPNLSASLDVGRALVGAGADLMELGVPFSDPLADGPIIQAAGHQALEMGATFDSVLEEVAAPLARELPVVLMVYANQVLARGAEQVAEALVRLGIAGLIVPDLPVDEAADLLDACDRAGVALVPLVAPTTPPGRIETVARAARGFIYVVSVTGVTGERGELPSDLRDVVARVREATSLPVAVGFGIATPRQAGEVGEIADGVIIGSRLVRAIAEADALQTGLTEASAFLGQAREQLA